LQDRSFELRREVLNKSTEPTYADIKSEAMRSFEGRTSTNVSPALIAPRLSDRYRSMANRIREFVPRLTIPVEATDNPEEVTEDELDATPPEPEIQYPFNCPSGSIGDMIMRF
jgi:hypothetical protein